MSATDRVLREVAAERARQDARWGEEVCEATAESDPARLRAELIQVAAVVVNWVEAIDRRPPRQADPS